MISVPVRGALEAPYTPRYDFQGISDDADLQAVIARLPQFTTGASAARRRAAPPGWSESSTTCTRRLWTARRRLRYRYDAHELSLFQVGGEGHRTETVRRGDVDRDQDQGNVACLGLDRREGGCVRVPGRDDHAARRPTGSRSRRWSASPPRDARSPRSAVSVAGRGCWRRSSRPRPAARPRPWPPRCATSRQAPGTVRRARRPPC